MKNKKGLLILSAVVVVCAVGFIVSPLVNWSVDSEGTSGDIGKTSRFSRKTATESISNMEELIQNDPAYKSSIVTAYVVMNTRAQQFGALVDMSNDVAGEIDAFAAVLKDMNDARVTVDNVRASIQRAGQNLNASLGGESCPDLAQNTINASLAYATLQKQNKLAGRFIDTTDKYLESAEGNDRLKFVRDEWVDYQMMTAALEGDEASADALKQKGSLLSAEQAVAALGSFPIVNQLPVLQGAGLSHTMDVDCNLADAVPSEVIRNIFEVVSNATQEVVSNATQEVVSNATQEVVSNATQEVVSNATQEVVSNATQEVVSNGTREVISNVTQEMVANALTKQIGNTPAGKGFLQSVGWDVVQQSATPTLGAGVNMGGNTTVDPHMIERNAPTRLTLGNVPFVMSSFNREVVPSLHAAEVATETVDKALCRQIDEVISNTAAGEKAVLKII